MTPPGGTRVGADTRARLALALVAALLAIGAVSVDLPRAAGGEFWGDGATYYAMASSLAHDFDLRFEARDLERVRREYPGGPEGIFLKRASGALVLDAGVGFPWLRRVRADEGRVYYAKAFAYPLVAAPFVRLLGIRGLLVANVLALALALWLGYGAPPPPRAHTCRLPTVVLVLGLATVTPLYLVWPTPEIFGFFLVTAALAAWGAGRPLLSPSSSASPATSSPRTS